MTYDPAQGGRRPPAPGAGIDLLKLPIIGPLLARLLGGGIGARREDPKGKDKEESYGKHRH